MATATWSSGSTTLGTTAGFRALGKELSDQLAAISGLTKTADTGQIDWSSVNIPGTNYTDAGYEIYYLNDSLHATAPVYIKLHYGRGADSSTLRLRVEIGTGSNGSGTLTGLGSGTVVDITESQGGTTTATAVPSYLCVLPGYIMLSWKAWYPCCAFALCRTCDADGNPTGAGLTMLSRSTSSTNDVAANGRWLNFETAHALPASSVDGSGSHCAIPYNAVYTDLSTGDYIAWRCWGFYPDMRPLFGCIAIRKTIITTYGVTATAKSVGDADRTFIYVEPSSFGRPDANSGQLCFLWLWE